MSTFLKKLVVKGCTRLEQLGYDTFELDFTKPMQVFIGSNGSGKSSLAGLCSPLPPDTADFKKGGYKEAHCHYKGSDYICITDFGDRNGHYFEKDGEVLNNWGTATIQRALIEQEMGLTPQLFNLLSGQTKFTEMSPIERRDTVMLLSKMNIDWLLDTFNKARTLQRDAKGYLTSLTSRLELEAKSLLDEAILIEKQDELAVLKEEFEYYSNFAQEADRAPKVNFKDVYTRFIDRATALAKNAPRISDHLPNLNLKDVKDLDSLIVKTQTMLTMEEQSVRKFEDMVLEASKVMEAQALLSNNGIGEIEGRIESLAKQISDHTQAIPGFNYTVDNPTEAKRDYDEIYLTIRDMISNIPDNLDGDGNMLFTTPKLKEAREEYNIILGNIDMLVKRKIGYEHRLEHINNTADVDCPDCGTTFKPGIKGGDKMFITNTIFELDNDLSRLETHKMSCNEYIQVCDEFLAQVREVYNFMSANTVNKPLWDEIRKMEIFKDGTDNAVEALDLHIDLLKSLCIIEDLEKQKTVEEHTLKQAQEAYNTSRGVEVLEASKLDKALYEARTKQEEYRSLLSKLNLFKEEYDNYLVQINTLDVDINATNTILAAALKEDRANFIKKVKFDILTEINNITAVIDSAKTKQNIYNDIVNQQAKAKRDFDEHSQIVVNLSPNTGIIADVMHESISKVVTYINAVIDSVWTSELSVQPCLNKKGVLDWKFPVLVENGLRRPDISKTSTAQTAIINTAIQFITANHVGMKDFPMFFDEFGSSMDEQHQINSMDIVSDLIESGSCKQIFLISHFAAFHNRFTDAETLVLDPTNIISLPDKYNLHVKFS